MSIYEASITNPKKQLEFYKQLSEQLQQENKQLKDNWNKLREYVGIAWYSYDNDSVEFEVAKDILNKMQELEQGGNSNDSN